MAHSHHAHCTYNSKRVRPGQKNGPVELVEWALPYSIGRCGRVTALMHYCIIVSLSVTVFLSYCAKASCASCASCGGFALSAGFFFLFSCLLRALRYPPNLQVCNFPPHEQEALAITVCNRARSSIIPSIKIAV